MTIPSALPWSCRFQQLCLCAVILTCGLGWFFTIAWKFAIGSRTAWLIALLAITSTVVLFTQSYICAIVISHPHVVRPTLQAFEFCGWGCRHPMTCSMQLGREGLGNLSRGAVGVIMRPIPAADTLGGNNYFASLYRWASRE